ncbi:LuxR C-terminal-related transcriptional regulator [Escherichia marmotae]|nr:LuxR C-terminal-related transcriptional regulator [Escherichia marmotae]
MNIRLTGAGHGRLRLSPPRPEVECEVLELLVKGYSVTRISESRFRSVKTVSLQKHQIYKKLGIRNDITFWLDLSLSSCVKMKFTYKEGTVKESPLSCLNNVSNIAHNISCKNPQQE